MRYLRWTKEEDSQLREVYEKNSKETIMEHIPKDWLNIRRRARMLNLSRNPEIINKDRMTRKPRYDRWTEEEKEFLVMFYPTCSKTFILEKINRPWRSIWNRAYLMGLHRDHDNLQQEKRESGKRGYQKMRGKNE